MMIRSDHLVFVVVLSFGLDKWVDTEKNHNHHHHQPAIQFTVRQKKEEQSTHLTWDRSGRTVRSVVSLLIFFCTIPNICTYTSYTRVKSSLHETMRFLGSTWYDDDGTGVHAYSMLFSLNVYLFMMQYLTQSTQRWKIQSSF